MSKPLIAITGLIYLYIAVEQAVKGGWSMSVVYAGYALANVGLFVAVQ
jgi:hypothetical protein